MEKQGRQRRYQRRSAGGTKPGGALSATMGLTLLSNQDMSSANDRVMPAEGDDATCLLLHPLIMATRGLI